MKERSNLLEKVAEEVALVISSVTDQVVRRVVRGKEQGGYSAVILSGGG